MEQPVKTVYGNGDQIWRLDGERHRDDGPAFIGADGTQGWYQYGEWHRDDGPAWIKADGTKEYWFNNTKLEEGSLKYRLVQEKERRKEAKCGISS